MVEPHMVLPEGEIKRYEEIEKKYNQLRHETAKTDETLKAHTCDHSECEKKIAELKDKYEKEKRDYITTKEKDSEEILGAGTSHNFGPGSTEYDPENIHLPESLSEQKNKKTSNPESPTSSTSKKPWYYIGSLDNI